MSATENIAASAQPQSARIEIDWKQAGALIEAAHAARDHIVGTTNWAAAVYRHMAEHARKASPPKPTWWRKRADEIEAQAALTGSPEAMRCYTDMRTLLQAAAEAAPQQEPTGLVESAVTGAGGFHVRLAPGAQMPAPGTKLYTAPQPSPLSNGVFQKTWALLDELEKLRGANRDEEDWGTLNKRDNELRAALAAQGGE